ncbi:MAG: TetR/AcrR family transcriptional regulator [Polyangiales bacterium]
MRTVPRKQAVQPRAKATVDAILEATARVLVREGYDRASTNKVAEAAGVSIGSLYQYFPSKEALVAALIERHTDEMMTLVRSKTAEVWAEPVPVVVETLVRAMIEAHAVDPKLHKVFVEQVPRVGRLERLHDLETEVLGLARGFLEAHKHELRPIDLDVAAFVSVATIEALTHAAVLVREDLLNERLVREIRDVVVRYLMP